MTRRTASDEAADRVALLRLHAEQRTAHLQHRADLLVAGQADTLWNVSGGRVSANPREQARASFQRYFDASTFAAWDDVAPPRIRISADGRMAYVIVEKRVHVTITPSGGGAPVVGQPEVSVATDVSPPREPRGQGRSTRESAFVAGLSDVMPAQGAQLGDIEITSPTSF